MSGPLTEAEVLESICDPYSIHHLNDLECRTALLDLYRAVPGTTNHVVARILSGRAVVREASC